MKTANWEELFEATDVIANQIDAIRYLSGTLLKDGTDPTACGIGVILGNHIDKLGEALELVGKVADSMKTEQAA